MRIFLCQMTKYFFWILLLNISMQAQAQTETDSLPVLVDTTAEPVNVKPKPLRTKPRIVLDISESDSLLSPIRLDTISITSNTAWQLPTYLFLHHPYYQFTNAGRHKISVREWNGKEGVFYSLLALLIFFALIKNGFYRYIQDLTKTFFRTTVRQRQVKEQMLQSPLPSLLLNIFFLLSTGMFLALLLQHYGMGLQFNFWLLFLYCGLALACMYTVKFFALKLMGWVFGASEAADTYIFVVFSTNKIIGIALLPVVVVIGFNTGSINQIAVAFGAIIILGLFAYRFFLSFVSVHRLVNIGFFHFLLYLASFELTPLLLINKLLFGFLS